MIRPRVLGLSLLACAGFTGLAMAEVPVTSQARPVTAGVECSGTFVSHPLPHTTVFSPQRKPIFAGVGSALGVNDLDSVEGKILERLRDDANPVSVLVALNHNVTLASVEAAKQIDGELNIAGFDYNVPVLEAIDRGEVLMAVQQNLLRQASSAMFVTLTRFGLTDRMAAVGVNVRELIQPVLLTVEAKFIDSTNVGETINLFRALPRLAQRNLAEASE